MCELVYRLNALFEHAIGLKTSYFASLCASVKYNCNKNLNVQFKVSSKLQLFKLWNRFFRLADYKRIKRCIMKGAKKLDWIIPFFFPNNIHKKGRKLQNNCCRHYMTQTNLCVPSKKSCINFRNIFLQHDAFSYNMRDKIAKQNTETTKNE